MVSSFGGGHVDGAGEAFVYVPSDLGLDGQGDPDVQLDVLFQHLVMHDLLDHRLKRPKSRAVQTLPRLTKPVGVALHIDRS